jgi:hypothetical protein
VERCRHHGSEQGLARAQCTTPAVAVVGFPGFGCAGPMPSLARTTCSDAALAANFWKRWECAMDQECQSVFGTARPPRKEDVLFGFGEDCRANAIIRHWHGLDAAYSSCFRRAAYDLAVQVCDSGSKQDILIYPIVYLYRHHVELVLKGIIEISSDLLGRELPGKPQTHDLGKLWHVARPLLDAVCELAKNPPFPPDDLEGVDSYIKQIGEHDPDGQSFRYATSYRPRPRRSHPWQKPDDRPSRSRRDREEVPSLKPELKLVNIRQFTDAMEKLSTYLEGIESWFDDLHQAEMRGDTY